VSLWRVRRIDAEYDAYLLLVHFHPLDQRPDDVSTGKPISFMQPSFDACRKLVEAAQDQREFSLQTFLISHVLSLFFHLL
jgi:hypothetical protein